MKHTRIWVLALSLLTVVGVAAPASKEPPWTHVQRLLGYWGAATDIAFTDDPRLIVCGDSLGRVTVWDIETGLQELALPRQPTELLSVEADGSGRRIAAASSTRITVWDTRTGRTTHAFPARVVGSPAMVMSRDGKTLVARTAATEATVWDIDSGTVVQVVSNPAAAVTSLSLSADGSLVAAGWSNKVARVYDTQTGEAIMTSRGHLDAVRAVHLAADGSRLATGSNDGTAKVWDVPSGELVGAYGSSRSAVASVQLNSRGSRLLTVVRGRAARMWNVGTGKPIRTYAWEDRGGGHLVLSPDDRRVAVIGAGYGVWLTGSGRRLGAGSTGRRRPSRVQLSSDGGRVLAFHRGGYATLHDTVTGARRATFDASRSVKKAASSGDPEHRARSIPMEAIRLVGDGRRVVGIAPSGHLVEWDPESGDTLRWRERGSPIGPPYVLSPDGSLLLTGGTEGQARVWDIAARHHRLTVAARGGPIESACFDAANTALATGSADGSVRLWDLVANESRVVAPANPGATAYSVSLSPNGRYLLMWRGSHYVGADTPAEPSECRLWDLHDGVEVAAPPSEWIGGCAWSPDSARLYTIGFDHTRPVVKTWSPHNFTRLADMPIADTWTRPSAVRPKHPSHQAMLWEPVGRGTDAPVADRAPTRALSGLSRMSLSSDGSTFATIANDGCIDIWRRRAD